MEFTKECSICRGQKSVLLKLPCSHELCQSCCSKLDSKSPQSPCPFCKAAFDPKGPHPQSYYGGVKCELCDVTKSAGDFWWCELCRRLFCSLCNLRSHPKDHPSPTSFRQVSVADALWSSEPHLHDRIAAAFHIDTEKEPNLSDVLGDERATRLARELMGAVGQGSSVCPDVLERVQSLGVDGVTSALSPLLRPTKAKANPIKATPAVTPLSQSASTDDTTTKSVAPKPVPKATSSLPGPPSFDLDAKRIIIIGGQGRGTTIETIFPPAVSKYKLLHSRESATAVPRLHSPRGLRVFGGCEVEASESVMLDKERLVNQNVSLLKYPPFLHRKGAAAASAILEDGSEIVILCGGFVGSDSSPKCEVFKFKQDAWSPLPDMCTRRRDFALVAVGPRFYAIGGRREKQGSNHTVFCSFEYIEFGWDKWIQSSAELRLPIRLHSIAGAVLNGRIYVSGGIDEDKKKWIQVGQLCLERAGHGMVALRGMLYAIGGTGPDKRVSTSIEEFNPLTKCWKLRPEVLTHPAIRSAICAV